MGTYSSLNTQLGRKPTTQELHYQSWQNGDYSQYMTYQQYSDIEKYGNLPSISYIKQQESDGIWDADNYINEQKSMGNWTQPASNSPTPQTQTKTGVSDLSENMSETTEPNVPELDSSLSEVTVTAKAPEKKLNYKVATVSPKDVINSVNRPNTNISTKITRTEPDKPLNERLKAKVDDWVEDSKVGSFVNRNKNVISAGLDVADKMFTNIAGERDEFSGKEGALAKSMESGYDAIADKAAQFGPYGQLLSLGMKANKFVGNVVGKLGGSTDGMTKADSILGSPFFQMTPLGLINGFGGKKADTFSKDNELFAQMGASYGASSNLADAAGTVQGKKYGLFSSGARGEANRAIAEAKRQQTEISKINTEAQNRNALQASMSGMNAHAFMASMQGGYNQSAVRVGRYGTVLRAKRILSQKRLEQRLSNSIEPAPYFEPITLKEYKVGGVIKNEFKPKPTFIKSVYCETISEFKKGGTIIKPIYLNKPYEEEKEVVEFKEGGAFNVIPEGALHKNKHHMENSDNLTKKGIPVISELEDGSFEQQAEIEKEEIIFRLSVTKRLEELAKENTDESAIEAGKLLVQEILYNTIDNTNKLL